MRATNCDVFILIIRTCELKNDTCYRSDGSYAFLSTVRQADDCNGELSAPSTCSTNQASQWSTTGLASTAVEPPGSVPEERQPQVSLSSGS